MPCPHKFQPCLNLTALDFEPDTLIVGTFNPAWPATNQAKWFYGNTSINYFWDILPRLYGEQSLINDTQADWKQFCRDKKIAFTDLISSIDDADPGNQEQNKILGGLSDRGIEYNFDDFTYTDVVQIIQRHPSIKNVYFTRGISDAFWKHLWNPAIQYCNRNHLHERRLLPSSDAASYQHGAYNNEHPDNKILLLEDYILMRWKQEWHF